MIPDFALQIQEIEMLLASKQQYLDSVWVDGVNRKYNEVFVSVYKESYDKYLQGDSIINSVGMKGMGLNDLLEFLDKKGSEMESLSGDSFRPVASSRSGRVCNINENRGGSRSDAGEIIVPLEAPVHDEYLNRYNPILWDDKKRIEETEKDDIKDMDYKRHDF